MRNRLEVTSNYYAVSSTPLVLNSFFAETCIWVTEISVIVVYGPYKMSLFSLSSPNLTLETTDLITLMLSILYCGGLKLEISNWSEGHILEIK